MSEAVLIAAPWFGFAIGLIVLLAIAIFIGSWRYSGVTASYMRRQAIITAAVGCSGGTIGILAVWFTFNWFQLLCQIDKSRVTVFYNPVFSTPFQNVSILQAHRFPRDRQPERFDYEISSSTALELRYPEDFSVRPPPTKGEVNLSGTGLYVYPWIARQLQRSAEGRDNTRYGAIRDDHELLQVKIYASQDMKHCLVQGYLDEKR
jgi:hypothetical protein